jgi:DNA repair protein RadC
MRPRRSAHARCVRDQPARLSNIAAFSTRVATTRVVLVRDGAPIFPDPIRTSAEVFRLLGEEARTWDRERFLTVILDGKNRVVGIDEVAVGTATAALVHPREVLKTVLLANGVSIILVHNHPSGDPTPSEEDVALTRRIKAAAELMGIRFLDHVVLGDGRFRSLAEGEQLCC